MKIHRKLIICMTLALCVGASACSRPKQAVIPTDPAKWSELSDKTKDLEPEEKRLLSAYLMRNTLAGIFSQGKSGIPEGTTIGKAIDDQREFEAKQKIEEAQQEALKARALAARKAAIDKLNHMITFAVVSKSFIPQNVMAGQYSNRVAFIFAIKNNTPKDIAGVKGVVQFGDMFGATIENVSVSIDRPVAANSESTIEGFGKDINQFENDDQQLAATDLSKMKIKFVPEMIVFADGTSQKAPDDSQ